MTITNGQARRISAAWQAPRNAFSALQHMGRITPDLVPEIDEQLAKVRADLGSYVLEGEDARLVVAELEQLRDWAEEQGVGKVDEWSAWDDTPVKIPG